MAALPTCYIWNMDAPEWTYAYYHEPVPDKAAIEALTKQCRREARAEVDRQILRGISRLQATRAREVIEERRRFGRVVGKRQTERARRRRA